jgi:PleD family two-component response regulator
VTHGDRPHLRLLDQPEPVPRTRSEAKATHPAHGLRQPLLFVSGDHDSRIVFTRIAKRWPGIKLLVATSGEEGLDMAVKRRPRMVVLDACLPDVDGEQLVVACGNWPCPRRRRSSC